MRQRLELPLLLTAVGALVTLIHEYLYARIGTGQEYHILGLISHGGIDMVLGTIALTVTAAIYVWRTGRTR